MLKETLKDHKGAVILSEASEDYEKDKEGKKDVCKLLFFIFLYFCEVKNQKFLIDFSRV